MTRRGTTTGRTLRDEEARARIREDLETTLFVEAAAGTGKTTEMIHRIVSVIRSGRGTLDRMVAVTFTDKAAGEMKLRLRGEIERCRAEADSPDERGRFDRALEQLEVARMGTIHSFCADLLRERPIEAGIDPRFEVAPEDEAERLLDLAFDSWFEDALDEPPEGVRRVLRRRTTRRGRGPRAELRSAASALVRHRDFEAPWRRDPYDRDAAIDGLVERLRELGELYEKATDPDDWLAVNLGNVTRYVQEILHPEKVRGRDHDALEAQLRVLARGRGKWPGWHYKGSPYKAFGKDVSRQEARERRDAVKEELDRWIDACDADLAPCLREELRPVVNAYEELKTREGKLDFLDLLIRARDLVREDAAVRRELQDRFTHFFVDEFQDTDPLQAEIVLLLSADDPAERDFRAVRPSPGKLFLVGDPKQSIYRFRRADVALYERVKRRLVDGGAEVLHLTTSFRGVPALHATVNAAFEPVMRENEEGSQAGYVPLVPFREDHRRQPAVIALPVPRPWNERGWMAKWAIDRSLPDAVGAFVQWLVERSGFRVTERGRPDDPVPVRPRHVCLLFRRFKGFFEGDVARPYARALEARRVPHVLVGGRSFHDRDEVLALRNALCAIEWPDDALRVFATLRGPLFALGDHALLAYRHRVGPLHPMRRVDRDELEESDAEVAEALAVLGRLHVARNRRPIAETLVRLLESVRAHAGIAIGASGDQALANCMRLVERAHRFERGGAPSFRSFVERLEEEAEAGEAHEASMVEEGTEGVRIMTVHAAKGLEFPVVILADPSCRATRERPSFHADGERGLWAEPLCGASPADLLDHLELESRREEAEAIRVAYVAATRARDLLVVPAVGDPVPERSREFAETGWLDVLRPVVYPAPETKRDPRPAPGCPRFGRDSVFERGPNVRTGPEGSVAPGLHRSEGGTDVVWWDPHALPLDVEATLGLRQQRILEADEKGTAEKGIRDFEAWRDARAARLESGARASLDVQAARAFAAARAVEVGAQPEVAAAAEPVECIELGTSGSDRPRGTRFGTLVHAVLAHVPLDAGVEDVRAVASRQARMMNAPPAEVDAAIDAVRAALAHPLLERARDAVSRGGLRREAPVILRTGDGQIVEGTLDFAMREEIDGAPAWTVVDFKSDRPDDEARRRYEEQVRLYARAVAEATGERSTAVLVFL